MQGRQFYLEVALQQSIESNDSNVGIKLIKMILEDSGAGLEIFDSLGRSLLCEAIYRRAKEIADELLEIQQDADTVLFARDKEGKTLIHYAVTSGYVDIIQKIIILAEKKEPGELGYKIWLKEDGMGRTPLHIACQENDIAIVSLLLEKISQECDVISILNQVDISGNTALHLAARYSSKESADLMVRFGADLFVVNDQGGMALSGIGSDIEYMARHGFFIGKDLPHHGFFIDKNLPQTLGLDDISKRMNIMLMDTSIAGVPLITSSPFKKAITRADTATAEFSNFSATERESILAHCRRAMIENPLAKEVRAFYFSFIGTRQSLTELMLTKFNYDPALHQFQLFPDVLTKVPQELLQRMSRFLEIIKESKNDKTQFAYKMLNTDREEVNDLIKNIDLYLVQLRNKVKISDKALQIKIDAPFMVPMLYLIAYMLTLMTLVFIVDCSKIKKEIPAEFRKYDVAADWMFYTFPITGTLIPWLLYRGVQWGLDVFLGGYVMLSPQEWSGLIKVVEDELLGKLHELENRESTDHESYLPTSKNMVRDLDRVVGFLRQSHSVDDSIRLFEQLRVIINTIKEDMNKSNKPISLFFKPKKIESRNECVIDIADESTSLVTFKSPRKNYGGF